MTISSHYLTIYLHITQLRAERAPAETIETYLIHQGFYDVIVSADFAEGVFDGVLYGF
jgi:hypothetical protein